MDDQPTNQDNEGDYQYGQQQSTTKSMGTNGFQITSSSNGSLLRPQSVLYVPVQEAAVIEGDSGPLQHGTTMLSQVAPKLVGIFRMVTKDYQSALVQVNALAAYFEEGQSSNYSQEDYAEVQEKSQQVTNRQEKINNILLSRGVIQPNDIPSDDAQERPSQVIEPMQLKKYLQRVWTMQDMLVKEALIDDFDSKDEDLGDTKMGLGSTKMSSSIHGGTLDTTKLMATGVLQAGELPVLKLTDAELSEEPVLYKRKATINYLGCFLFFLYITALLLYIYIRVVYTLKVGARYVAYGVVTFAAELGGALAMLIYGITIVLDPVFKYPDMKYTKEENLPVTRNQYHIRVMIPCYSEPVDIVKRTAQAAHLAPMPVGCRKTVYICDDGKDPKKRQWVEQMNTGDLKYVSGRVRPKSEVNGKSGNLNNCMQNVIYKKVNRISKREAICIFDADMVCSKEFFIKTVPLLDLGDDVGMVLSPQCFHNVDPKSDILNHQNIHFWEYMQPGFDALNFISCTGTNFLARSQAMKQCGWFPSHTITEDFGLGISLTKFGWKCKYVQDYLAIGEAPTEIRNAFQQRSRWCKGHFQLFFSPACPLLDYGLNLYQRLMFSSSIWSYISAAFITPYMLIIPLISVHVGVFPIEINFWAAIGLTIYYICSNLLQFYVKRKEHVQILWFAGIGNIILWPTYLKGIINSFLAAKMQRVLTFKTTAKGKGAYVVSTLKDLWLHIILFIVCFGTFIYGLFQIRQGVNQTLAISLCWCLYNSIPYYTILHYTYFGRGRSLQIACLIGMWAQWVCGIVSLVLLWVLLPSDWDYFEVIKTALTFFDVQRSGTLPVDNPIAYRANSFTEDSTQDGNSLDGGWHQGSVSGYAKITMQTAFSTTMLAWAYLAFPKPFNDGQETDHLISQIKWGASYLRKTFNEEKKSIVAIVGDLEEEGDYWGRPEDSPYTKNGTARPYTEMSAIVQGKKAADPNFIDLSASVASALASSAVILKDSDLQFATQCLQTAAEVYAQAAQNAKFYDPEEVAVEYNSDKYTSGTIFDDLSFAAAWLYKATGRQNYLQQADKFMSQHLGAESRGANRMLFNWDNQYWGTVTLLYSELKTNLWKDQLQRFLLTWTCGESGDSGQKVQFTVKGRAVNSNDDSLSSTMGASFLSSVYAQSVKRESGRESFGFSCHSLNQARYVLGDSGQSLIVGVGDKFPKFTRHRVATCPDAPNPCSTQAKLSNEPNINLNTGAVVYGPKLIDKYVDSRAEAPKGNGDGYVSIEYNAAMVAALAGVKAIRTNRAPCLQGYGESISKHPVCKGNTGLGTLFT